MSLCRELRFYFDHVPRSAALNMALDEAIFESTAIPALRAYRWDHAALSFGYFGKFSDVERWSAERDVVRRWTGGGIVFHGDDLTYSLTLPANGASLPTSRLVYSEVHAAMRDALRAYGQASELARADSSRVSEACFERPVAADLMQGPRKIAGAAQRRNRRGLLQQGSAQIGNLPDQFVVDFAQYLCPETQPEEVPAQLIARAEEIATERYASSDWLHRR